MINSQLTLIFPANSITYFGDLASEFINMIFIIDIYL